MKLDQIAGDAGLDVNGEALLARAKQLVKLEVGMRSGRTRTKTDGRTKTDRQTDIGIRQRLLVTEIQTS